MNYPLTSDGKDRLIKDLESQITTLTNKNKQLEEERNNLNLKCNHSCECTDCQWRCVKCETERFVERKTKNLEEQLELAKTVINEIESKIKHLELARDHAVKNNKPIQSILTQLEIYEEILQKWSGVKK